jgi:hypothetical protein
MKTSIRTLSIFLTCAAVVAPASAAPLDALLSANQGRTRGQGHIEAGYDLVNDNVDVFKIRQSTDFADTNVGDYRGAHVRGGIAVTPDLWLDGGLWKRKIDYRNDQASINTWQVAAQYRLLDGAGSRPSVAVRAGAWGNYADQLTKSSPTSLQGVTLNSVNVVDPKDTQYQLDLIATWQLSERTELSAFGGIGASRVKVGSINGTTTQGGCNYNLAFGPTGVVGTPAQMCNASTMVDRFSLPYSAFGVDPYKETRYNARFVNAGLSAKWTDGDWQLRGGYQYQALDRDNVDDLIRSRGGKAVEANHILIGEVMYKLVKNVSLFARGQYMSKQFTGEIPFAYNTMTARRFDQRYGILTTGVVVNF